MLTLDETLPGIAPEYTSDLIYTRLNCNSNGDLPPSPYAGMAAAMAGGTGATAKDNVKAATEISTASEQTIAADTPSSTPEGDKDTKEEDLEISKRFEEQCFLLDALEEFAKANSYTQYKNFIALEGTKDDAALLVSKINSRFGENENGLKQFMNITPAQYSMLVPKIRLFVQKRQDEKDKFGMIQELRFKDFTNKSSVEDIMKSATGRGDDAGLVSFSYEFDGRDPGSVTNMIRGSIRLLFTDFDTLIKPIRGITEEEKDHFAPTTPIDFQYLEPRFLDLIVRQPTRKKIEGTSLPFLIRVHAEIGWQIPEDATNGNMFPVELKKYIDDGYLNEYLVLDILEHEMDFKEDGRIELSIDYRAGIENVLFNQTDILEVDKDLERRAKEKLQKLKNDQKVARRIDEEVRSKKAKSSPGAEKRLVITEGGEAVETSSQAGETTAADVIVATSGLKLLDIAFDAVKRLAGKAEPESDMKKVSRFKKVQDQKVEFTKESQKIARYRKLLDRLEGSEKIKFIDLDSRLTKKWISEIARANLFPDDANIVGSRTRAAAVMRESGVLTTPVGPPLPGESTMANQIATGTARKDPTLDQVRKSLREMDNKEAERLKAVKNGDSVSQRTAPKSNFDFNKHKADAVPGSDKHRIHFMYLGDIMDVACEVLYELEPHLGLTRIVSGPVQYVSQTDGQMKNINLADIPISLEALSDWIYRNIIAKGITGMSLGDFLSSLVTDLAFEALGQKTCFGNIKEYPSLMMSPIALNLKGAAAGELTEPIARVDGKYPRTSVNNFASQAKNNLASRGDLRGRKRVTTANYVFLNGVVREENNFNYGINSFNVDFHKNGVYNLGIGRDRGIVKNIKFTKSDAPYQLEMRVEQRQSEEGFTLGEFRQVYNATVKLVGNTLFRNGQYVRLDPSTMGLDQRTAIQLGLGGMYVITKVEGELSRSGYETTLTCKYNSTGESKRKIE